MPGIAVKTEDMAGGKQIAGKQVKFKVRGNLAVVRGDLVEPHGGGEGDEHDSAKMVGATDSFRIAGIATCRAGHLASCGHATTGRSFFRIP